LSAYQPTNGSDDPSERQYLGTWQIFLLQSDALTEFVLKQGKMKKMIFGKEKREVLNFELSGGVRP